MADLLSGQEPIRIQSTMSAGGGESTTITSANNPAASRSYNRSPAQEVAASGRGNPADFIPEQQTLTKYQKYVQRQQEKDKEKPGEKVASDQEWAQAWVEKQNADRIKTLQHQAEAPATPTPLLMDKAAALPAGSAERRHAEIFSSTLDNTTSGVGSGLDNLTRESYKETKRTVKISETLQTYVEQPLPKPDELTGTEGGQLESNLQSAQPAVANAVKPVSDAIGSHADTTSSVVKNPTGPDLNVSVAAAANIDTVSPQMTNEVDVAIKSINVATLPQMPSKLAGSLTHLTTCRLPNISMPFDLNGDAYNGLRKLMNAKANLQDAIMGRMTQFAISPLGGLRDGFFPSNLLSSLMGPISKIGAQLGSLTQLLGGFSAIKALAGNLLGLAGGLSSIIGSALKLASLFKKGAKVSSIVGGAAGQSVACIGKPLNLTTRSRPQRLNTNVRFKSNKNIRSIARGVELAASIGSIISTLGNLNGGLGNLGTVLSGKGIGRALGKLANKLRHPEQIIQGLLSPEILMALLSLHKCCNTGRVGNQGYSVGDIFDQLQDKTFDKALGIWATHAQIISPLFNKQSAPVGAYAREPIGSFYENSPFVRGAQGNKGVTAIGPRGTLQSAPFGGASSFNNYDSSSPTNSNQASTTNPLTDYDRKIMQDNRDRINVQRASRGEPPLPPPKTIIVK